MSGYCDKCGNTYCICDEIEEFRRTHNGDSYLVATLRKTNPYPETVFTEPSKEEYDLMNKLFKENGLVPDRFFGSLGRRVWDNCTNMLKEILEGEEREE